MTPPARLRTVVLDCPEPLALAEFYRSLIGGELEYDGEQPDWVVLQLEPGQRLAFQQADTPAKSLLGGQDVLTAGCSRACAAAGPPACCAASAAP